MQGDPTDCCVEQLEPRQSPGPRAGLEDTANKLNSERLDEMTFTLVKSLIRLACRGDDSDEGSSQKG